MQQKLQLFCIPFKILLFLSLILIPSIVCYNILNPLNQSSVIGIGFLSQLILHKSASNSALESHCDYSYGNWASDETQPIQKYTENCPFLDPGFRCQQSGREDMDYQKWRWQPQRCNLPTFDAADFLRRIQNGRIVFAGDSIGRNQWESLICMLMQRVSNQSTVYEQYGNPITKHKGYLSIQFHEYNLSVEYYRVPFLVMTDRLPPRAPPEVRGVVRVDTLHWYSAKWVGADVLIFSAGHWWNKDKTVKMGYYFQEGGSVNVTMDVMEAFRRSLNTLKSWVMNNLEPGKSHIFFRSYSPVHYRDGEWNEGGNCDMNTRPETDYTKLEPEPLHNILISEFAKQMEIANRNVQFLNITYLTEFRKDGHPSSHREPGTPANAPQDCSHWCLPGVPDTWNELLYANLLKIGFRTKMT
ncbi:Protein trichome birefringence-like 8 [Abeliophyllum distichum]|uniref:Protein trichome birefringence-like 8 n=1 Tax=Abeliophyllum distichum TaxID=126358 RepID=A0ABD1RGQ0_9LAMI